jgi:anti-sigma B factor antagonist
MADMFVTFIHPTVFTVCSRPEANGVVVVSVAGEVDLANADELRAAFAPCLADPAVRLVVCDLSRVTFLACSGLSALLDAQRTLALRDARIRVVAQNPAVIRPITVTGLSDTLPVSHDFTTALAR